MPKEKDTQILGIFWECSACGFRFIETPVIQSANSRECPLCGHEARVAAVVPARATTPRPPSPTEPKPRLAVLLDNVRSAYNVGSAFRVADGAGVTHLYLAGITPTPPHRGIAKTALGAEFHVPWSYHPNAPRLASALRSRGWTIWALETASNATSLKDMLHTISPATPLLIIAGNERVGIDPELLTLADEIVTLPMLGEKASLNVTTALAVALYSIRLHT